MSDKIKKVTDEEFEHDIGVLLDDAIQFADGEMTDNRIEAKRYYNSQKLGNEEPGRSQFVVSEVRDGISGVIPSILRVIFGAERAAEFVPRSANKAKQAEQVSDYIHYVFSDVNGGFMKMHALLKDGLVGRLGAVKWWWDANAHVTAHQLEDIPESQLYSLLEEEGVEILRIDGMTPAQPPQQPLLDAQGQPTGEGAPGVEATYRVDLTHTEPDGVARFAVIPPEELIFNRQARSATEAALIGHRTTKTTGELIEMGIKPEDIEAHGGNDERLIDGVEQQERASTLDETFPDPEVGKANAKHLYVEAYVKYDFDGDGIAELRKVCTMGRSHFVVLNEPIDEAPLAVYTPDPEPHVLVGRSWADRLMDLQRVESMLVRSTLDSLALSIYPRIAYVEGEANVTDIMNTEIGAPIRVLKTDALLPFKHEFAGREALPLFDYFSGLAERRTGRNMGTVGLDADALQSSTKSAVGAAINGSQEQTELLARIFAEGTLKPLFRGLMKLYVQNQPKAATVRLRGKWEQIDPRTWDASMDVSVKVALGSTMVEQKVAVLDALATKIEQVFGTVGVQNPLFTLAHYGNVIKKALNLQGFPDTSEFMNDVDPNWAPPEQPPQESPEQILATATLEAEKMKTEKELAIKQATLNFEREKSQEELALKREQMLLDAELKKYEIDKKAESAQNERDAAMEEAALSADIDGIRSDRDQALAERAQDHAETVAEHDQMMLQQGHEQEMQQGGAGAGPLKEAIALHEKHMNGTAPTTGQEGEESQKEMMRLMKGALAGTAGQEAHEA